MKKNIFVGICVISALILGSFNSTFAADIEHGEQIFTANCTACHAGGNNAIMPSKTLQKEVLEEYGMYKVDAIVNQVTNGKGAMPAFGGRLSDSDIDDVANYVLAQAAEGW